MRVMKIPYIDLQRQYRSLGQRFEEMFEDIMSKSSFVRGDEVRNFEIAFSGIYEGYSTVSTASGTDALFIVLKCLGIGSGDEVITPAFSWISSSETISLCNAVPVFSDVDEKTYTLDPRDLERRITQRTRGIVIVHLFGQAAHAKEICRIAHERGIVVIEDCAQAHLTMEGGQFAGTFGAASAFSFYPTKNLGAYGDAGCILTANRTLEEKMRRFGNHGALGKDDHAIEGINSRMDSIQASVLLLKLKFLRRWNAQRVAHARLYHELLSGVREVTCPFVRPDTEHTFHIFAIRVERRDALKEFLGQKGIQTIIHYPKSLPNLPAYRRLGHTPHDFPVASRLEQELLSLPIYPELREDEIHYIAGNIKAFYLRG